MGLTSVSKQLFSLLLCLLLNNRLQYSPPFLLAAILEKSENTENTSDVSNVIRDEYIWLLGKYRHCIMILTILLMYRIHSWDKIHMVNFKYRIHTNTYSDYIQLIRLSNFLSWKKLKLDGKWQNPITIGKKILRKCVLSSSFYYLEVVLLFVCWKVAIQPSKDEERRSQH